MTPTQQHTRASAPIASNVLPHDVPQRSRAAGPLPTAMEVIAPATHSGPSSE